MRFVIIFYCLSRLDELKIDGIVSRVRLEFTRNWVMYIHLCSRAHCHARVWVCADYGHGSPAHGSRSLQDSPRVTSGACVYPPLCLVWRFRSQRFLPQTPSYDSDSILISLAFHKVILTDSRDLFFALSCICLIFNISTCSIDQFTFGF